MRFIYRRQLGEPPREIGIGRWAATAIGILVTLAAIVVLLLAIPLALIGILVFVAFVIVMLLVGWVYLGLRIGFRELWDLTKLVFGVGFGPPSSLSRAERIRRAWEERTKGRSGEWMK